MNTAIDLVKLAEAICISLAALGGGIAVIVKVINSITLMHDQQQKYDGYDERIKNLDKKIDNLETELNNKIDTAHGHTLQELKDIQQNMDQKLEEIQTSNDAKFQQMLSELCMHSYCIEATLDGLKQLNCNGMVTEAKEKLSKHINQQAHGEV